VLVTISDPSEKIYSLYSGQNIEERALSSSKSGE